MDEHGYRQVTPVAPDASQQLSAVVDLKSGYVQRATARLPKQGARLPWRVHQNYFKDLRMFRRSPDRRRGRALLERRAGAGAPGARARRLSRRVRSRAGPSLV